MLHHNAIPHDTTTNYNHVNYDWSLYSWVPLGLEWYEVDARDKRMRFNLPLPATCVQRNGRFM